MLRKNSNFKDVRPRKYSKEELENAIEIVNKFGYNKGSKICGISKSTLTRYRKERS